MEEITGVTGAPDASAVIAGGSPPPSQGSSAPNEQADVGVSNLVQGEQPPTTESDPLAGIPSLDEINAEVEKGTPYAKGLAQLRSAYEPLKTQHDELTGKYKVFESVADRFEQPEQVQSVLDLHDSLIGWDKNPQTGLLEPATQVGAEKLQSLYPQHAEYLAADLMNMEVRHPVTGQAVSRMNLALEAIAQDKDRRAAALRILGGVEPSSIAPQWQPGAEELEVVNPSLHDEYARVPWEKRQSLKLSDPEFINEYLEDQQFKRETRERDAQRTQFESQQRDRNEQYITQQANDAGDKYVDSLITNALTTFHNSVVEQCNFIQPLDPNNLPQGITAEQATALNQQITASNKAEAAQITSQVVNLINPQTRRYALATLKETGIVDDKFMDLLDRAASAVGDNGRNYGHLFYRGQMQANGQGFQAGADLTGLKNAAEQNLNKLVYYANQIKGKLIENRSNFFSMKATGHNQTLNNAQTARPTVQGTGYDPTTATEARPRAKSPDDLYNPSRTIAPFVK